MAVFPIRVFPDPVLRAPTEPITDIDAGVRQLAQDMLDTMYEAPGVGLAAPQIGISRRIFVFDVGEGPHVVINSEIQETADETDVMEEGCLSIPGHYWDITRPVHVTVRGLDLNGDPVEHAGGELLGRVLQHESDHLDGLLIIDRLPKRARKQALRDLRDEAFRSP